MKNIGVTIEDILPRVQEALAKVNMSNFINSNTFTLSGGEMQRIAIATILAMDPKTLVLDEPTTMLDSTGKMELHNTIVELNKSGYTVLFTTNVINEALMANRIIILDDGYVVADTTCGEILKNPAILEQYGIEVPDVIKMKRKLDLLGINIDAKDLLV